MDRTGEKAKKRMIWRGQEKGKKGITWRRQERRQRKGWYGVDVRSERKE